MSCHNICHHCSTEENINMRDFKWDCKTKTLNTKGQDAILKVKLCDGCYDKVEKTEVEG